MTRSILELNNDISKDIELMWDESIFVFDTNIVLGLYEYSKNMRNDMFSILDKNSDRIWLPYHVLVEYMRNRNNIIKIAKRRNKFLKKKVNDWKSELAKDLNLIKANDEFDRIFKDLERLVDSYTSELSGITINSDRIMNKLSKTFGTNIGNRYTTQDLQNYASIGRIRFDNGIPPGYMDNKKSFNAYGDYIIWDEIKSCSLSKSSDVIFVTEDSKQDWVDITDSGKRILKFELLSEFNSFTGHHINICGLADFLGHFGANDNVINEVDKNLLRRYNEILSESGYIQNSDKIYDQLQDNNASLREISVKYKQFTDEIMVASQLLDAQPHAKKIKEFLDKYVDYSKISRLK